MLKKRNAQGLTISVIIMAVVGLIIVVVLVAMLTGNLGGFSKGARDSGTCTTVCKAAGYDSGATTTDTTKQTGGLIDSDKNMCKCP
jgi:hypothetical protein